MLVGVTAAAHGNGEVKRSFTEVGRLRIAFQHKRNYFLSYLLIKKLFNIFFLLTAQLFFCDEEYFFTLQFLLHLFPDAVKFILLL